MIRTILVHLDSDRHALARMRFAIALARRLGAVDQGGERHVGARLHEARQHLAHAAERAGDAYPDRALLGHGRRAAGRLQGWRP